MIAWSKHPGQHKGKGVPGFCSKDPTYLLDPPCYISGSKTGRVCLRGLPHLILICQSNLIRLIFPKRWNLHRSWDTRKESLRSIFKISICGYSIHQASLPIHSKVVLRVERLYALKQFENRKALDWFNV